MDFQGHLVSFLGPSPRATFRVSIWVSVSFVMQMANLTIHYKCVCSLEQKDVDGPAPAGKSSPQTPQKSAEIVGANDVAFTSYRGFRAVPGETGNFPINPDRAAVRKINRQ